MSLLFKVEITAPSKTFTWTPDSETVESIDLDLHKEQRHISCLNVRLHDPRDGMRMWPIYNSLPDPAFANVGMKLYLSDPTKGPSSVLVFDGRVSSLQAGYPASSYTSVVGHDKSLSARLQARYKTYKNLSGLAVARQIAKDYGLEIDSTELTGMVFTQRAVEMGFSTLGVGVFSDWNQLTRALAVDGLELFIKGKKLHVRQSASHVYPTAFRPDDETVVSLDVQTNHVYCPGAGGLVKTPLPGGYRGDVNSVVGNIAVEALRQASVASMHRTPPQGANKDHTGAHTESSKSLTGWAEQRRKRKDEATLVLGLTPDIGMQHLINLKGWGQKIDGNWYIDSIHHSIAGKAGTTQIHLTTKPTTGSVKQAGLPPAPGGTALPAGSVTPPKATP